jgi:ribosomal-protein-alanine N-acetyltransferase
MLDLLFEPFPVLETERLVLRKITMTDAADIFLIRSNADTMKYIGRPLLHSISEAQNLIGTFQEGIRNQINIIWGISVKSDPRLVGTIGYRLIDKENLRAEVGYVLGPDVRGKGYASEALAAVIDFGFAVIGLHSIEARVNPDNVASSKMLLKHRFVKEAHFREDIFFNGSFRDSEVYSLRRNHGLVSNYKKLIL